MRVPSAYGARRRKADYLVSVRFGKHKPDTKLDAHTGILARIAKEAFARMCLLCYYFTF